MDILVTITHLVACFALIIVVLLQKGKGADLAGAFGGGGSQTALGVRSATQIVHKLTIAAAVFFMITSYTLGLLQSTSGTLITEIERASGETTQTPADTESTAEESDDQDQTPVESESPAEENQNPDNPEGEQDNSEEQESTSESGDQ